MSDYRWTVTHVKSGHAAIKTKTKAQAKAAAKILAVSDVNWDYDDPVKCYEDQKDKMKEIKAKLYKIGLL